MRAWANLQEAHPRKRGLHGKKFDICDAHPHVADYVSVVLYYRVGETLHSGDKCYRFRENYRYLFKKRGIFFDHIANNDRNRLIN